MSQTNPAPFAHPLKLLQHAIEQATKPKPQAGCAKGCKDCPCSRRQEQPDQADPSRQKDADDA